MSISPTMSLSLSVCIHLSVYHDCFLPVSLPVSNLSTYNMFFFSSPRSVWVCVCVWCLLFMYAWLHTQHGTELQLYLAMLNGKNKNMTNKPKYATINHSSLPYSCITIQSLKPLIRAQHCLDIQVWNVLILMVTLWVLCEIVMNHRRSANGLSHLWKGPFPYVKSPTCIKQKWKYPNGIPSFLLISKGWFP